MQASTVAEMHQRRAKTPYEGQNVALGALILMSGYSPELDDAEALARAGVLHVPKPFEAQLLARRVREALDAR